MSVARLAMLILALLAVTGGPEAGAAMVASPDAAAWLAEASGKFEQGATALRSDRAKAESLLRESIGGFQRLIDQAGVRNGEIYYNIGNAYAMIGDDGRAILNYRRAERFIPSDPNLHANLALALARVPDRFVPETGDRVARTLLFWHYDLPAQARFWAFATTFAVAWLLGLARLSGLLKPRVGWAMALLLVISTGLLASLLAERALERNDPRAVIVGEPQVGRKGPDETAYEPSFTEPLHPGIELRIVERRARWALVRLADGRETWLPVSSLEWLWPPATASRA